MNKWFSFKRLRLSFIYALQGLIHGLRFEQNLRIHVFFSLLVGIVLAVFAVPIDRAIAFIFAVTLVLVTEMFNTAIERVVDLVSPELRPLAKIAKDVSAGAVLIAAIGAIAIGLLVLYGVLHPLQLRSWV